MFVVRKLFHRTMHTLGACELQVVDRGIKFVVDHTEFRHVACVNDGHHPRMQFIPIKEVIRVL